MLNDDFGKLMLRWMLGILMIFHGVSKLTNGVGWLEGMLVAKGVPAFVAYGVYIGEVVAPILLILGLWSRLGGILIAINMLVAIILSHPHQIFMLGKSGGIQLELQAFFLFSGLIVAVMGAGRYSLGGSTGKWN